MYPIQFSHQFLITYREKRKTDNDQKTAEKRTKTDKTGQKCTETRKKHFFQKIVNMHGVLVFKHS